jgi:glycosyltransferase involved in cell wall biosynthesis
MRVVFFSFYYPPDLSAGSFRAISLAEALEKKLNNADEIHVISTYPNRYANHQINTKKVKSFEDWGILKIHRIPVPVHSGGMFSQIKTFTVFAFSAYKLSKELKPDFIIGTTSRLMTGILTYLSSNIQNRKYFIDLRDIFSESISDLFMQRNKFFGKLLKEFFFFIERKVLVKASGVNIVSEGFIEYFSSYGIDTSNWTFFPNGIDKEFLGFNSSSKILKKKIITIVYAGNIGKGQGLETIIPETAKRLGNAYQFLVIGDGSSAHLLLKAVKRESLTNVVLYPPVSRPELIKFYRKADILFLHLNDISAFKRVLPSKIFEYGVMKKPILAGLSGYSAKFLNNNISSATIFNPGDSEAASSAIRNISLADSPSESDITKFVNMYSREIIMNQMAEHLRDHIYKSYE